jgi:hypothetical protein
MLNTLERGFMIGKLVGLKKDLELPQHYFDQLSEQEKVAYNFEVQTVEKLIKILMPKRDWSTLVLDERTIKKTLTIPNYLNVLGEEAGINFSKVLTETLKDRLL